MLIGSRNRIRVESVKASIKEATKEAKEEDIEVEYEEDTWGGRKTTYLI
jgi:hypothetical protein